MQGILFVFFSLIYGIYGSGGYPADFYCVGSECRWEVVTDATSSSFGKRFNELTSQGLMLVSYEFNRKTNGVTYVSGLFKEKTDSRGWVAKRGLTKSSFDAEVTSRRNANWRLIDVEVYQDGSSWRYAGIFVENQENLGWVAHYDVSKSYYQSRVNMYSNLYTPVDVDMYEKDGEIRYNIVWARNSPGSPGWILRTDKTRAQFLDLVKEHNDYWVADYESALINGNQRYGVLLYKNNPSPGGRYRLSDLTWRELDNYLHRYDDLGYRVHDLSSYRFGATGTRYAIMLVENDRTISRWSQRNNVHNIAKKALDDNVGIVGMSVSVVQNGQTRFQRGYGFQNKATNQEASSKTIFRLASVSKPIGGILGYILHQEGSIDIDDRVSAHATGIPRGHAYTIRETLSLRSGIRHYGDSSDPTRQENNPPHFSTAQDALSLFIGDPLGFTPAGSACLYSTHGYTATAAAYEGATGKSINELVEGRISKRGYPTLQPEGANPYLSKRSRIYSGSTGNVITSRDKISWKVLGGGLESNSRDLSMFLSDFMNNKIVSVANKNDALSLPNGRCSTNSAGFVNTAHNTYTSYEKAGGQRGASSYIMMFPQQDIVITVMINSQCGLARGIAESIADVLLPAPSNTRSRTATVDDTPSVSKTTKTNEMPIFVGAGAGGFVVLSAVGLFAFKKRKNSKQQLPKPDQVQIPEL